MQSKASGRRRWWGRQRRADEVGNKDDLLAMRKGNHSSLPADTGTPGVLQGVLPAAASVGSGLGGKISAKIDEKNAMSRREVPFFPKIIPIEVKCHFSGVRRMIPREVSS